MRRLLIVFVAVLAFCASSTYAQDKPVTGYIAAGYSGTTGVTENYLQDGWLISGGAIRNLSPKFGVRFDFGYNRWDATNALLNVGNVPGKVRIDDGFATMFTFTIDGLWKFAKPGHAGFEFGLGLGSYTRYAAFTQTALISGPICDPWWGVCYPATAVGEVIVADDKLTKIGYNASFGFTFPMKSGGELYVEARYHRMQSEKPTEFYPIQLGFRW